MKSSNRKLKANRANTQKSTGPRTEAGREKVAQNAVKHGLCGRFYVLPGEDQAEYNGLLERFLQAEKPADDVERELVAKMARHTWLSERAQRFQDGCFLFQPQTPEEAANGQRGVAVRTDLDMYMRYQTQHDRAYQRASNELLKRRKERLQAERGFVSQERAKRDEERRDRKEIREVERFKTASAIGKKKLELIETRVFEATMASAKKFGLLEELQNGKIAA